VFAAQAKSLREERARIQAALAALPGVKSWRATRTYPGALPHAQNTFDGMKSRGVLVKNSCCRWLSECADHARSEGTFMISRTPEKSMTTTRKPSSGVTSMP